ncbi:hypothetical protein D3C80_286990 [compost metagenome]
MVGAEDGKQAKRQKNAGKCQKRVVDGHDGPIHPAARITADKADESAEDRGETDGQKADPDACLGSDHQAAQHIAAEFISPEKMRGARPGKTGGERQFHRVERRPEQAKCGGCDENGDEKPADKAVESELFHSATTRGSNRG